jgi:hypothetical protein
MGEREGLVSITVDALMKEHLSNRRRRLRTKGVFFFPRKLTFSTGSTLISTQSPSIVEVMDTG